MQEWYAIQTKPYKELVAREALGSIEDVQVYLPLLRVKPVNPRARKVRPFFPGYLFACVDLVQVGLSAVRWVPGVVRVLGCGDQPVAIPESVIQEIRCRVEEAQQTNRIDAQSFQQGERVRITSGPLEGFEGMFDTRLAGQMRARILVEFVGRFTPAEVDIGSLEKLSPRSG